MADDEPPSPEPSANIDVILFGVLGLVSSRGKGGEQKYEHNSPAEIPSRNAALHLNHPRLALLHFLQLFRVQVFLRIGPVSHRSQECFRNVQVFHTII